jgi:RNA polymerase primary sigma factor
MQSPFLRDWPLVAFTVNYQSQRKERSNRPQLFGFGKSGTGMAGEDFDTSIKIYLREIGQIPLLTPQEEIDLAARIKKGDREARALMIKANLRLVVKIAHDYANLGLPLLDLVSEGNIGLMKAVERFDPAKGGKLSTYGAWWIKQSIKRALANQSKTIRLPVHLVDKISKMRRVSLQISEELGREPTDDELAEEVGLSSGKVFQLKTVSIRPASLDAPISDEDSTEFGETVGDEDAQTPFELLRDKSLRAEVSDLLEALDDRERKIIFQRFGLDGGKPKTLEEVGKKFRVTRERIRQLQNVALVKMRRALNKKETPFSLPQWPQKQDHLSGIRVSQLLASSQ